MPHPVIVGVDASDRAHEAITLGRLLADTLSAPLLVIHVYYDDALGMSSVQVYRDQLREEADAVLAGLADPSRKDERHEVISDSSPARALHRVAEAEQARLIVVASSHRGRLGRTLLGDIAGQTLHAAPCAVAVAPRGYTVDAPERIGVIGVGVDGEPEAERALAEAASIAEQAGARLRLRASSFMVPPTAGGGIWLTYDPTPILEAEQHRLGKMLEEAAARQSVPTEVDVVPEPPVAALAALAEEVDLLVVGSRDYGPVGRLLLGTVSGAVLQRAACPVLVLPRAAADARKEEAAA